MDATGSHPASMPAEVKPPMPQHTSIKRTCSGAPPSYLTRATPTSLQLPNSTSFLNLEGFQSFQSFTSLLLPSLACNGSGACPNMMGCVICVKRRQVDHPSTADGRHHTRRKEASWKLLKLLKHKEGKPAARALGCRAGWSWSGGR